MTRSMTGFGRASMNRPGWTLTWEIASRNARYLELKWKLPPGSQSAQPDWEAMVRRIAHRGSIDLCLHLRLLDPDLVGTQLDTVQATAMIRALGELATRLGLTAPTDLTALLGVPALWRDLRGEVPCDAMVADASQLLGEALQMWDEARKREGTALDHDLKARLASLRALAQAIGTEVEALAPARLAVLTTRVTQLLGGQDLPDPARLHLELAILADKTDVSEELTRLAAHLDAMERTLAGAEPKGRKLDFLVQEVLREITTCSNKAQSATVSALAVDFKTELEKVREQVQNLE